MTNKVSAVSVIKLSSLCDHLIQALHNIAVFQSHAFLSKITILCTISSFMCAYSIIASFKYRHFFDYITSKTQKGIEEIDKHSTMAFHNIKRT